MATISFTYSRPPADQTLTDLKYRLAKSRKSRLPGLKIVNTRFLPKVKYTILLLSSLTASFSSGVAAEANAFSSSWQGFGYGSGGRYDDTKVASRSITR